MARRIQSNPVPIANPQLLGVELVDVGVGALGLAATAYVNDKAIAPLAKRVIPGLYGQEMVAKIADALTTLVTAWALGRVVDIVTTAHVARWVTTGGGILAAGRLISAFVPDFQISSQVPKSLDLFKVSFPAQPAAQPAPAPSAAPALAPGAGMQVQQTLGIGTTGL